MLTDRQIEFLALAAQGMNRTQIAAHSSYSLWTVRNYLDDAREELQARTIAHAVVKAIARGALFIDDDGVARVGEQLPDFV